MVEKLTSIAEQSFAGSQTLRDLFTEGHNLIEVSVSLSQQISELECGAGVSVSVK